MMPSRFTILQEMFSLIRVANYEVHFSFVVLGEIDASFLYSLICSDSFQDSKTGIKINYPNIVFYIGGLEVIAHPQVMW